MAWPLMTCHLLQPVASGKLSCSSMPQRAPLRCGRAAGIDRGIHAEAAAAGLRMREAPGTRQRVPGGLEGVVYTCRHSDTADTETQ
jgi:hypothetical protein